MALEVLNTVGLRCPLPILELALKAAHMKSGDVLEICGDCPTLERDVRIWCERLGKAFLATKDEGSRRKRIQLQL